MSDLGRVCCLLFILRIIVGKRGLYGCFAISALHLVQLSRWYFGFLVVLYNNLRVCMEAA